MQEKQLHKLGKTDLLTLIYKQEKQIQRLTKEVEDLKQQLEDRTIQIKEAGSIAEASLKINKIFEVAQQAADEYLRSIKEVNKPSHECAEISRETSKDKANLEIQNNFESEDTYEENTNDKITKELILVNNKISMPKTKLLKKVLIFLTLIGTAISRGAILVAQNTVLVTKKIKLGIKINFIKLKCKVVIIKNFLLQIVRKIKQFIIRFYKFSKKLLITIVKKTKRKIKRLFKKLNCNIEKVKRFTANQIKAGCNLIEKAIITIGKTIWRGLKAICKLIQKICINLRECIQKTITKCKVRLIVFKFKTRNKKSYKIKLLGEVKEEKTEQKENDNALILINNSMILYKTNILIYVKKYLKLLKTFIVKISIKIAHIVSKILKKIAKVTKIVIVVIFRGIKKIARIIIAPIKKASTYFAKRANILKMRFINKIKHTKLINEINDHIHIEETKNALILTETGIKPFKQKILIRLVILLKKVKIKVILLSLKVAKRTLIMAKTVTTKLVIVAKKLIVKLADSANIARRKLIIVIKKTRRLLVKNCKKLITFIKRTIIKIREKIKERKVIKQMSKDTHTAIIKNLQISMPDLEKELKRRKQKSLKVSFIKTLTYSAMVVVAFAIITSTSFFKILQVSGTSMQPTLTEGELLITSKFFKYEKGDMVAFYYNDSVLIKRVIATENDIVNIEYDGTVYVNSVKLEESYVKELALGNCDITFPYQVPKNSVFILGDNRKDSIDSRSKSLGSISTDKIIGKIQFRLNPFVIY